MKKELFFLIFLFAVSLIFMGRVSTLATQEKTDNTEAEGEAAEVPWIWGEVKAVDTASSIVKINYLDYQTDEEKEIALAIDKDTKFENAGGIGDIKPGDIVSVEYVVSGEKSVVKNISVERIDVATDAVPLNPESK